MIKYIVLLSMCAYILSSKKLVQSSLRYHLSCTKSVVVINADKQKTGQSESVIYFYHVTQIYSWRKWEAQAIVMAEADIHGK